MRNSIFQSYWKHKITAKWSYQWNADLLVHQACIDGKVVGITSKFVHKWPWPQGKPEVCLPSFPGRSQGLHWTHKTIESHRYQPVYFCMSDPICSILITVFKRNGILVVFIGTQLNFLGLLGWLSLVSLIVKWLIVFSIGGFLGLDDHSLVLAR